jgi:tetratricopeptide (TPR) repeat protein
MRAFLRCACLLLWAIGCLPVEPADVGGAANSDVPVSVASDVVTHRRVEMTPSFEWIPTPAVAAPISLTASDGSGLRLLSVGADVVVEDPLAFTQLHLTFENPEARRREGRFEVELPPGAALSRLAMKVRGRWMEGEVVEKARARQTFEHTLHFRPRIDPALLEQGAANRISARVFPILPHERKEIIVSYSQPIRATAGDPKGSDHVSLPLRRLPRLDNLDVRAVARTHDRLLRDRFPHVGERTIELHRRDFAPTDNLVIALERSDRIDDSGDAVALRSDTLVALRVRPFGGSTARATDPLDAVTILFDTSASTAERIDDEIRRLDEFLVELGDRPLRLIAFDQAAALIHDGPASAARGVSLAALSERRAFGASDLEAALSHPALRTELVRDHRVILWTDGVATAGATEGLDTVAKEIGAARVDAIVPPGSNVDASALAALVLTGSRSGTVLPGELGGRQLLAALSRPGFDDVDVAVEGAIWSYPRSLGGYTPGEDVVVYARFGSAAPEQVRVGFSDPRLPDHVIPARDGPHPLISRAVARAQIEELERTDDHAATPENTASPSSRERIVELAVEHRLLTRHTALLVLESEAEYRRYGIRRAARSNILIAGAHGVDVVQPRDDSAPPASNGLYAMRSASDAPLSTIWGMGGGAEPPATPGRTKSARMAGVLGLVGTGRGGGGIHEGTIGLGNVGLVGKGGGGGAGVGYGRGAGAGFGGRGARIPQVRQARARVEGALDRDIVRRVVRSRLGEVRHCYERGLRSNPNLSGRVELEFTITSSGRVGPTSIADDTLGAPGPGRCIAQAARRWTFPRPRGGGNVRVRYPFTLSPDGVSTPARSAREARAIRARPRDPNAPSDPHGARWRGSASSGPLAEIQSLLGDGDITDARARARAWVRRAPRDVLAYVALGEALEIAGEPERAARVYGSLIDLFPHRVDLRRAAGQRLEAVGEAGRELAIDTYEKAVQDRPDHLNGRRLLAWAYAKERRYAEALDQLNAGIQTRVPAGRFRGAKSLLRDDARVIAAAWRAIDPDAAPPAPSGGVLGVDTRPSFRLVAHWETDATDVDILVDPIGRGHGRRHADVRTGYGPEAWVARGAAIPSAASVRVRYFSRGAMGHAFGTVTAVRHDGAGHLSFQDHPFVLMRAAGSVDVGRFRGADA